jgi:hypothetical protein
LRQSTSVLPTQAPPCTAAPQLAQKLPPPFREFVSLSLIVAPLLSADRKETLGHFRLDLVPDGRVRRVAM